MPEKKYFSVVTDIGNNLMANAVANGEKVEVTEIAVGDGGGSDYRPDTGQQQLKHECWRGAVNSCTLSPESPNILVVSAIIPGAVGGFTIREMGIFNQDNKMIAVCNTPATPKVMITDGVVNEMNVSMELALINGSAVELVVDPNIITATKADIAAIWDKINSNGKVLVGPVDTDIDRNDILLVTSAALFNEARISNMSVSAEPPDKEPNWGNVQVVDGKLVIADKAEQDTTFFGKV